MKKEILEGIIVGIILVSTIIFKGLDFVEVVNFILGVIVLWEVIRMLTTYVLSKKHNISLRIALDGFIIFFLRDLLLVFSDTHYSFEDKVYKMLFILFVIFTLILFRFIVRKMPKELWIKDFKSFFIVK